MVTSEQFILSTFNGMTYLLPAPQEFMDSVDVHPYDNRHISPSRLYLPTEKQNLNKLWYLEGNFYIAVNIKYI